MSNDANPTLAPDLGPDTIKYLGELAHDSFKRQIDLDESVWRSLPFFAATFAFVATIIGRSAGDVPAWSGSPISWLANLLLMASVGCLAWALRWFWVVLRRREYEYPAADAEVFSYAQSLAAFHGAADAEGDPDAHAGAATDTDVARYDASTVKDLRLFMIDQYGNAAATNLLLNAEKLKARPKALLFMLLAFALAFACEATIFVQSHIGSPSTATGAAPNGAAAKPYGPSRSAVPDAPPSGAANASQGATRH